MNSGPKLLHIKIKLALAAKGMTQKQLARAIGCTDGAVSQWIKGRTTPSLSHVLAIAQVTGFWVGWFVEDERPADASSWHSDPVKVRSVYDRAIKAMKEAA